MRSILSGYRTPDGPRLLIELTGPADVSLLRGIFTALAAGDATAASVQRSGHLDLG